MEISRIVGDGWVNTDPDRGQYGRKISDTVFEFFEPADARLCDIDDYTEGDEVCLTVDLSEYSREQLYSYCTGYYSKQEFESMFASGDHWIIAECIFEQLSGLY